MLVRDALRSPAVGVEGGCVCAPDLGRVMDGIHWNGKNGARRERAVRVGKSDDGTRGNDTGEANGGCGVDTKRLGNHLTETVDFYKRGERCFACLT